jgi:type II secretory pathway predicted ATPase ExeA
MYESFFQLKCKPFSLLPDPDFLFLSSRHSVALSLLEYSLTGQAGFCVITGEIGSGKTTLVRAFLGRVGREFSVGLISNTHSSITDVAGWALTAFGQKQTSSNPAEVYQQLMAYLIAEYGGGRQCMLIVDEAQNLSIDALEELRLLSNINSGKDLLLQILLVGQPELLEKLKRPELRQFAQRIAISHHLSPLKFTETRQYIEHRLAVAGATTPIFGEMAVGAIQYFSGGVPRLINSICDLCLVYAFADGLSEIDEALVFRVITDRQLSGIAPFAHANPADDPAVRAEISVLTRSAEASDKAEAAAEAKPAVEAKAKTSPAPAPADLAPAVGTPAVRVSVDETPMPILTTVAETVRPAAASTQSRPLVAQAPSDFYFSGEDSLNGFDRQASSDSEDSEDSDLLLTCEADDDESVAATAQSGAQLNGDTGRVVLLHAEPSDRLQMATPRATSGITDTGHQFPATENSLVEPRMGSDSLRIEETLRQAAPGGTGKGTERSWWRRAFRREG